MVSLVLLAGVAVRGKKGSHMKAHLRGSVLIGYPHRASASSKATTAEALASTLATDVVDAGRHVVTVL